MHSFCSRPRILAAASVSATAYAQSYPDETGAHPRRLHAGRRRRHRDAPDRAENGGGARPAGRHRQSPGAGGNIAAELGARAPADGYTLFAGGAPAAISQTLYPKLCYDLLKDFEAVALVASVPNVLVVHPSLPAKNVKELVAIAKARPGELTYASTGSGSSPASHRGDAQAARRHHRSCTCLTRARRRRSPISSRAT